MESDCKVGSASLDLDPQVGSPFDCVLQTEHLSVLQRKSDSVSPSLLSKLLWPV